MTRFNETLFNKKYEFLLAALLQHLFIGIFLTDLNFYTKVIWPINMMVLGLASAGIFIGKTKNQNRIRNFLFILVLIASIGTTFAGISPLYMQYLSLIYVFFFFYIFLVVMQFLIRPSYLNLDIISAAACGYFLLIEVCVFLFQTIYYGDHTAFRGIDGSNPSSTFIDFVYYCSITFTSIGFGDIVPTNHITKLLSSLTGLFGQFYTVILVGILISKFTSRKDI